MKPFAELVRTFVRPFVLVALTITFCALLWQGRPLPPELLAVYSGVLGWWFGERTAGRVSKESEHG